MNPLYRLFLLSTPSVRAMLRVMPPLTLRQISRCLAAAAHQLPINTGESLK